MGCRMLLMLLMLLLLIFELISQLLPVGHATPGHIPVKQTLSAASCTSSQRNLLR